MHIYIYTICTKLAFVKLELMIIFEFDNDLYNSHVVCVVYGLPAECYLVFPPDIIRTY